MTITVEQTKQVLQSYIEEGEDQGFGFEISKVDIERLRSSLENRQNKHTHESLRDSIYELDLNKFGLKSVDLFE